MKKRIVKSENKNSNIINITRSFSEDIILSRSIPILNTQEKVIKNTAGFIKIFFE
jgi:hypothetical protein